MFIGIRNFIVGITVKVASDEVAFRKEKTYINKLNLALVQVCVLSHIFYHLSQVDVRSSNKNGPTIGQTS